MWHVVGRSRKGESFAIAGLEIWRDEWEPLDEPPVPVWDPVYGRTIEVRAYRVRSGGREVVFGAAEVAPDNWLICRRALPGC